jgi:predicted alpha/beta-fold hydrolase
VPTLILHALDDPFVRISDESCSRLEANPNIRLITTHHGGHCAFLAQPDTGYDGYWAEHTLLRFLLANA